MEGDHSELTSRMRHVEASIMLGAKRGTADVTICSELENVSRL